MQGALPSSLVLPLRNEYGKAARPRRRRRTRAYVEDAEAAANTARRSLSAAALEEEVEDLGQYALPLLVEQRPFAVDADLGIGNIG